MRLITRICELGNIVYKYIRHTHAYTACILYIVYRIIHVIALQFILQTEPRLTLQSVQQNTRNTWKVSLVACVVVFALRIPCNALSAREGSCWHVRIKTELSFLHLGKLLEGNITFFVASSWQITFYRVSVQSVLRLVLPCCCCVISLLLAHEKQPLLALGSHARTNRVVSLSR